MLVEIKIVKSGTDIIVHRDVFAEHTIVDVRGRVAEIIEDVTRSGLDDDDKRDILAFTMDRQLASRFGSDWEFYVEAIVIEEDEIDFDPEFDNLDDKYTFVL